MPRQGPGQVLAGPPLLEIVVPLVDLLPDTLELVGVPGPHGEVLVVLGVLGLGLEDVLLREGLAADKAVAGGETTTLLQLPPSPNQSLGRRHHNLKQIELYYTKNRVHNIVYNIIIECCHNGKSYGIQIIHNMYKVFNI